MPCMGGARGGGRGDYDYLIEALGAEYIAYDNVGNIDYRGTNLTTLAQAAIDALYAIGGGDIVTRGVALPETGLTCYANVNLIERYLGTGRQFKVMADGNLYKLGLQHGIIARPSIPMWETKDVSGVVYKDGYLTIINADFKTPEGSEAYFPETVGYGTYEWKAKLTTPVANRNQYVGFGEEAPTQYKDSIFVMHNGVQYQLQTYAAGVATTTALAGEDWTSEKTFKIEWALNLARLSVDGVVKATHNINVPTKRMIPFIEVAHAAAVATHTYVYGKDWVKTA